MKTIQVNELTDKQLDEFCAKAQGWGEYSYNCRNYWMKADKESSLMDGTKIEKKDYSPTSDTQAGKAQRVDLIEEFFIDLEGYFDDKDIRRVKATCFNNTCLGSLEVEKGAVEIGSACAKEVRIAITRAVVASVFGTEVDVEDE